jgi:hypothetical protein
MTTTTISDQQPAGTVSHLGAFLRVRVEESGEGLFVYAQPVTPRGLTHVVKQRPWVPIRGATMQTAEDLAKVLDMYARAIGIKPPQPRDGVRD